MFEIPLAEVEMGVRYRVNHGPEHEFFVPGLNQNMRWAAHSVEFQTLHIGDHLTSYVPS